MWPFYKSIDTETDNKYYSKSEPEDLSHFHPRTFRR